MIRLDTFAIINVQANGRPSPKPGVSIVNPYVFIMEPLAAKRLVFVRCSLRFGLGGTTDRSVPYRIQDLTGYAF